MTQPNVIPAEEVSTREQLQYILEGCYNLYAAALVIRTSAATLNKILSDDGYMPTEHVKKLVLDSYVQACQKDCDWDDGLTW